MGDIIEYLCPKCGSVLQITILASYPPKTKYHCPKCGWTKIEEHKIIRVRLTDDTRT